MIVEEIKGDAKLTLADHEGAFVMIKPTKHVTTDSGNEPLPADSDTEEIAKLKWTLSASEARVQTLEEEMTTLRRQLQNAKERNKELWKLNCAQLSELDQALAAKEEEIAQLQQRTLHPSVVTPLVLTDDDTSVSMVPPWQDIVEGELHQ